MLIDMFTPILTAAKLCTNCWNSVVFIKDWRMHGSDHEVPQIVHNRCHDAIFPRSHILENTDLCLHLYFLHHLVTFFRTNLLLLPCCSRIFW